MSSGAVFLLQDGRIVATELARGPWDSYAQHGGAPAALLMREFERLPLDEDLLIGRVTYEFLRPVPLGPLEIRSSIVRPGRRVQLLEASLFAGEGTEVVRARALRVRRAEADALSEPLVAPHGPVEGNAADFWASHRPMFATDAMEIRFVEGAFMAPGPSTAWFRLRVPLVAGEDPSPLQRLAAAGDFGNGISAVISWDDHLFINPDLTLYIDRAPCGEWICLQAETRVVSEGIGMAESVLFDERGRIGRATQALVVARR